MTHLSTDFRAGRIRYLQLIKNMIETASGAPWSIVMQHETTHTQSILKFADAAARDLARCMNFSLDALMNGKALEEIMPYKSLPAYREHRVGDSESGGAASALRDAALLIVSLDPTTFASQSHGRFRKDIISHLNGTLHLWLLGTQNQWQYIQHDGANGAPLLDTKIPAPEKEKATLSTMFKAVCHCLHIGPQCPSPFENEAAFAFADSFKTKLWPIDHSKPLPQSMSQECPLKELSILFQEWYFSVGKTQIDTTNHKSAREAENIFIFLRRNMHDQLNQCTKGSMDCGRNCFDRTFSSVRNHPFGERCYEASVFLSRNLL